jgi:hypothetical protein
MGTLDAIAGGAVLGTAWVSAGVYTAYNAGFATYHIYHANAYRVSGVANYINSYQPGLLSDQQDYYQQEGQMDFDLAGQHGQAAWSYGLETLNGVAAMATIYNIANLGNLRYQNATQSKPYQRHHYASNKSSKWTARFERITKKYNLDLDGDWNTNVLPHQGRHPDEYHNWVLEQVNQIDQIAQGNRSKFLELFELRVKQPVQNNPGMLYKDFWANE